MYDDTDSTDDAPTRSVPEYSRRSVLAASAATAGGAVALGSGSAAAAESCDEPYGQLEVSDSWKLMDNQWGMKEAQQCIWTNSDGTFGYDFSGTGKDAINYPQAWCGARPWGESTGVSDFPTRRGDIDELILEVDADVNISGGEWDFAEEWWLLDGQPQAENPPNRYEIMLVLDWGGGHDHYMEERNVWTDQFGNQIDYWADYPSGGTSADFHIFRVRGGMQTGRVDLKEIIDFMSQRHGIRDDLTFTGVELGNEYWGHASGETTFNELNVVVNGTRYESGPGDKFSGGGGPSKPTSPGNQWTNSVTTSSIELGWSSVENASEYNVYLDGGMEDTVSDTSYTFSGLSAGTQYQVGVEAVNDAGTSSRATTTVSTAPEPEPDVCADAEGGTAEVGGRTVCDVDGDGDYGDFNADGDVTHADVQEFFSVQHRPTWKQPDMFDFNGNQRVGHGDVVALFEQVAGGTL